MRKWMKREQRKINKIIRDTNRTIVDDPLWKGHFTVRQYRVLWAQEFSDHSGGEVIVELEFYDKQTKAVKYQTFDNFSLPRQLWIAMNCFIVEFVEVWREYPLPNRNNTIDYR